MSHLRKGFERSSPWPGRVEATGTSEEVVSDGDWLLAVEFKLETSSLLPSDISCGAESSGQIWFCEASIATLEAEEPVDGR